jgi:hypothetical protein
VMEKLPSHGVLGRFWGAGVPLITFVPRYKEDYSTGGWAISSTLQIMPCLVLNMNQYD